MIYTLPHDPEVLQAYCRADRVERPRARTAFPRWNWLDRLLGRPQEADPVTDPATDPEAEEAGVKAKTDALIQAARWGF